MAPDTPMAMYSLQALAVLPDCPTWRLLGSQPASAIGREQPSVAPIASASSLNCAHLGLLADAAADGQDELGRRHVDIVARRRAR